MSAYRLEPYGPPHRGAYLGLLRDAWGEGAMDGATFDWWFDGNPAGSLMSVATIDGDVVGVASHSLARLSLAGSERLAQYSVHAVTAERARGLGIFRALERRHEELGRERGSACVLAFASAPTHPLFLGPLGWSQIDRRRVWARPLAAALRRRLGVTATGRGDTGATTTIRAFGPEQEAAYLAAAPSLGNHLIRSAAYLQWRYLEGPRQYAAFASPSGFAVVGRTQRGPVTAALVMELIAPPGEARALLARCARESGWADVLLVVPSPCVPPRLLARAGFAPLRTRLDFMGLGLAQPLETRGTAWSVSLGDTDYF